MSPLAYTIPVRASVVTLWTVLLDERHNPTRYDSGVSLISLTKESEEILTRTVIRDKLTTSERIELHLDALMIEHLRSTKNRRDLTLIFQLIPSEEITLLNLAINVHASEDEDLTDPELPDLIFIAERTKEFAEAI